MLSQSIWTRLSYQLDSVATILSGTPPEAITAAAPDGGWSAHDHLHHLVRLHELLLDRLRRVLLEDDPRFEAEPDDEGSGAAQRESLATRDVVTSLQALRGELLAVVRSLTARQLRRRGTHPALGSLDVSGWLEYFCLHEAHHLHLAWEQVAAAKQVLSRQAAGEPA